MAVIPAPWRLRWEGLGYTASLGSIVQTKLGYARRPCLKTQGFEIQIIIFSFIISQITTLLSLLLLAISFLTGLNLHVLRVEREYLIWSFWSLVDESIIFFPWLSEIVRLSPNIVICLADS